MPEYLPIIIFAVVIYVVFKRYISFSVTTVPPVRHIAPASVFDWPELGLFDVDIVGESHYQQNIATLAGTHGDRGPDKVCKAHLIPEDDNPYDNQAIRVEIEGMTIGYLSRDDAPSFRRRLSAKKLAGQVTTCQASLKGGHVMKNNKQAAYGIMLDIKEL